MKNKLLILGVLILTALTVNTFGQQRIKFKRGATKTVVSGKLNNYKGVNNYVIRLNAGQTLSISSNRYITLGVSDPSGEDPMDYAADCHGRLEISPTLAGDYKFSVVECRKADPWKGTYKLNITAK